MILHTIIPEQCVLWEQKQQAEEYYSQGAAYLGFRSDGSQETLCRVVSTNPKDYLNPRYALGTIKSQEKREKTFEEYTSFRL